MVDLTKAVAGLFGLTATVDATSMKLDFLKMTDVRTDPIISTTSLSGHVHSFYGAAVARPNTTYADLRATTENSGNVEENKSLYWHPSIYKFDKSTQKYTIQDISQFSAYYVWQNGDVTAFPNGFKMIGGGIQDLQYMKQYSDCWYPGPCPDDDCETWNDFFPATTCVELEMHMRFPSCWDGVNLDSPDHRSHVAYPVDSNPSLACPASHPVKIPQIQLFTRMENYDGGIHVFADGTGMFHSDYFSGWDETFLQKVLDECINESFIFPENRFSDLNEFCQDHMTFRLSEQYPTISRDDEIIKANLRLIQPNPPFDPTTITTESITNVDTLPGAGVVHKINYCTGDETTGAPTTAATTTTATTTPAATTTTSSTTTTAVPVTTARPVSTTTGATTTQATGQTCPKNTFSSTYTQNADGTGTASGLTAPEIKQYVAMSWGPGADPLIPGDANGVMGTYSTDGSHFYVTGGGLEGVEGTWDSKKTEGIIIKIKPCDSTSEYSNNVGTILGSAGNNCATQYVWGTKLGGNDGKWDQVLSVKESPDGAFVIAVGAKHADTSGKTSRSMFKIDSSNGNIIWSKMMPNTESDIGFWSGYETVAFTEDGGVIAGGFNYPRNYQLDPIADTDSGAFTFKSGGQIGTEAGVIFDRFSVSAISANSQSAADALSWTTGGAVSWRYQHRSNQEESTENGSMKNCRVFKDAGVEKVIGVGGVKGHVHIVNVSDGSLVSMGKHNDDVIGQCADVEPIVENGVFTGYAQPCHIGKQVVGTGGMPDGIKTGQTGTVYHGQFALFDANHNQVKLNEFNNMAGGIYMFAGTPVPADVAVRTECWGIAKATTQNGAFDGFYMGCGQGAEPDACGQSIAIQSVQDGCAALKRQAWRSVTMRFDLSGNIGWYRMDNFHGADANGDVGTSANEYVASFGNKVIAIVDEGFGFGVTEYVDPTVVTDCQGATTTTQGPTTQSSLPFCTGTTTAPSATTTNAGTTTTAATTSTMSTTATGANTTPAATTTVAASTTTTANGSSDSCTTFGNTLVQSDGSIRMMDASRSEFCAFKKYSSYNANDEIWFKSCDVANANVNKAGKYRFNFDAETGLVSSAGAKDLMSLDLCWRISSLTRFGKQRVLLATCDAADANQKFTVINGRLHLTGETRICLGFEEHRVNAVTGIAMTVQDCYPSVFGASAGCADASLVGTDQAIFPTGLADKCLFKRYSGFNANDEIWVDACQAGNANPNKAGKYRWSYDAETGLISSVGALAFGEGIAYCMRINNKNRFYKQRVKLARCDASDELQQMDYTNGRIYSRANNRLCAGFEYNKLTADGKTAFIFSTCYPGDFAVDMAAPSRKRRQAGGASDAQFCQTYGDSVYSDLVSSVCAGSTYTGSSPGEFCSLLNGDFAELCSQYASCSDASGACAVAGPTQAPTTSAQTTPVPTTTTVFMEIPGVNCIEVASRKRRQADNQVCTPAPMRIMYISATYQSTTSYNNAVDSTIATQVSNILSNILPAEADADHVFVDKMAQGVCDDDNDRRRRRRQTGGTCATFTAEILYDSKFVSRNQVVAAVTGHAKISNDAVSVSDDIDLDSYTFATTTAGPTTTNTGPTTTTFDMSICDAEENVQCPNDSDACWANLTQMCGWSGATSTTTVATTTFDMSICDAEESVQCPDDSDACWDNLTIKCGW